MILFWNSHASTQSRFVAVISTSATTVEPVWSGWWWVVNILLWIIVV